MSQKRGQSSFLGQPNGIRAPWKLIAVLKEGRALATTTPDDNPKAPAVSGLIGLEAVYREHHAFVWRNARRLGCNASMLDDAVHEVFLVVARKLQEFRGDAQIRSWIFAITVHVVNRLRRDSARYAKRLTDYGQCRESETVGNGSEEAGYQLRQMLQKLPESNRLIFILVELEGMTSVEVGSCLGMKTGTVDTRLRAARLELEAIIEREQSRTRRFCP